MAFDDLCPYVRKKCHDFRCLGRYASWVTCADPKHCTQLMVAYGVGHSKPEEPKTVYQQHLCYLQWLRWLIKTNPCCLFKDNLVNVLKMWRHQGDRIILGLDMNDNVLTGNWHSGCSRRLGCVR